MSVQSNSIPTQERLDAEMALLDIGIALDEIVYVALPKFVIHPRTHWFRFMAFSATYMDGYYTLEYNQAVELLMEVQTRAYGSLRLPFVTEKSKTMIAFQARRIEVLPEEETKAQSWAGRATLVDGEVYHHLVKIEQPIVTPEMVAADILQVDYTHNEDDPVLLAIATTQNGSTYVGEAICGNMEKQNVEAGRQSALGKIRNQVLSALFYHHRSSSLRDAFVKLDRVNLLIAKPLLEVGFEL